MARSPSQENTARRPQILDADYVPQDQTPNLPRAGDGARGREGASAVFVIMVFVALLALGVALTRGDGKSAEESAAPAMTVAAGSFRPVPRAEYFPAPQEDGPGLGLTAQTLTPPVAAYYSMKDCPLTPGAQVYALENGGPAAAAGLLPGDVITAVDGTPVRTAEDLADALSGAQTGQTVTLTVFRGGETLELCPELGPCPGGDEDDFFHSLG